MTFCFACQRRWTWAGRSRSSLHVLGKARKLRVAQRRRPLPDSSRHVLVLAPHPDDETFGCGGTMRMLADSGVAVDVAFMTRGEQGIEEGQVVSTEAHRKMAEVRSREAREACYVRGVRNSFFLNGSDARLKDEPHLAGSIVELLRRESYQRVFCPWHHDSHEDHQATFKLLRQAVAANNFAT